MIKAKKAELLKKKSVDEWIKLQEEFNYLIYQCKSKMELAHSREETREAFVEGMNNLIGLLKG